MFYIFRSKELAKIFTKDVPYVSRSRGANYEVICPRADTTYNMNLYSSTLLLLSSRALVGTQQQTNGQVARRRRHVRIKARQSCRQHCSREDTRLVRRANNGKARSVRCIVVDNRAVSIHFSSAVSPPCSAVSA